MRSGGIDNMESIKQQGSMQDILFVGGGGGGGCLSKPTGHGRWGGETVYPNPLFQDMGWFIQTHFSRTQGGGYQ